MKKSICILLVTAALASCGPSTRIINSWRDPQVVVKTGEINKFMVAALLKNQSVRRLEEDHMASLYPGKAIQSYIEFGSEELKENEDVYNQKLKAEGYDGVVVMRLVNVEKNTRYVPGSYPLYYNTWHGYWRYSWPGFYDPGFYTTDKTYEVEVTVYSLRRNKLIWTCITSTVNPPGRGELFDSVIRTVNEKMKKQGFIQ